LQLGNNHHHVVGYHYHQRAIYDYNDGWTGRVGDSLDDALPG
jgi:hypothetical protein